MKEYITFGLRILEGTEKFPRDDKTKETWLGVLQYNKMYMNDQEMQRLKIIEDQRGKIMRQMVDHRHNGNH